MTNASTSSRNKHPYLYSEWPQLVHITPWCSWYKIFEELEIKKFRRRSKYKRKRENRSEKKINISIHLCDADILVLLVNHLSCGDSGGGFPGAPGAARRALRQVEVRMNDVVRHGETQRTHGPHVGLPRPPVHPWVLRGVHDCTQKLESWRRCPGRRLGGSSSCRVILVKEREGGLNIFTA